MIYKILHTFREEVFIPILALSPNLAFVDDKKKKLVITSDNVRADVASWQSVHILSDEARELVKRLYNADIYPFMRKWYSALDISSMEFIYMNLTKCDGPDN